MNTNSQLSTLLGSRKAVRDAIKSEQVRARCHAHGRIYRPVRDWR